MPEKPILIEVLASCKGANTEEVAKDLRAIACFVELYTDAEKRSKQKIRKDSNYFCQIEVK